jgi:hypothetical protein
LAHARLSEEVDFSVFENLDFAKVERGISDAAERIDKFTPLLRSTARAMFALEPPSWL